MSDDSIKRFDAIEAVSISCGTCIARNIEDCEKCSVPKLRELINAIPSVDRPQGEVDAVEIYERAEHNLEQGYITIGEFDERIEPLRHLCYGRPQGEWIFKTVFPNDKSEFPMGYLVCSVCGSHHSNSTPCNYCDNCGAQMRIKKDR